MKTLNTVTHIMDIASPIKNISRLHIFWIPIFLKTLCSYHYPSKNSSPIDMTPPSFYYPSFSPFASFLILNCFERKWRVIDFCQQNDQCLVYWFYVNAGCWFLRYWNKNEHALLSSNNTCQPLCIDWFYLNHWSRCEHPFVTVDFLLIILTF